MNSGKNLKPVKLYYPSMSNNSDNPPRDTPSEEVACRECGSVFNLEKQYYYDDLCPKHKREKEGEDAVNPVIDRCYVSGCDNEVRKEEEYWSKEAAPVDVKGPVLVCTEHRDYVWKPSGPRSTEEFEE